MGRMSKTLRIVGSNAPEIVKEIASRLRDQFDRKDLSRVDVLFDPEDQRNVEFHTLWASLDVAKAASAKVDDTIRACGGASIEAKGSKLLTAVPRN